MLAPRAWYACISAVTAVVLLGLVAVGCGPGEPVDREDTGIEDAGYQDTDPGADAGEDVADDVETDVDTGPDEPIDPDEPVECDAEFIVEPPDGERCGVLPGDGDALLIQGTLLAGDEIYEQGSVLVDGQRPNGRIQCVGCDCEDEPDAFDATVVSCPDGVISPGLINPHDHLGFAEGAPQTPPVERYDHRHDWRLGERGHTEISTQPRSGSHREVVLYGELRMLFGGATSIAGSTIFRDASGLLRNLDEPFDTEGLETIDVDYRTFPLGDSFGVYLDDGCHYPDIDSESRLDSGIYLPHLAEGIDAAAQNELQCTSGGSGPNLVAGNTSIIHGIAVDARDVARIAERGANLVWSPRTNIALYGNTAPVPLYQRFGVPISLGTDWSTSGSMNMLRELECADYLNRMHFNDTFDDVDLWKMATYNAAISMGAEHKLGLLYEEYVADITIFDGSMRSDYRAVIDADIDDIALVMRGGKPLYGDAAIVEGMTEASQLDKCEYLDVCDRPRRACVELDTGQSIDDIRSEVHPEAYPLFFCGDPENEPTCVPTRPAEYQGINPPTDSSGDGIPDPLDNCPAYFNPIRPMDNGLQADTNGTGLGDVCDPCPLSHDPDCTQMDFEDWSGDGIPNDEDNCPYHYNPQQTDSSGDGVGDVCSPCPDHEITDTSPCPATVYDVKTGEVFPRDRVTVEGAIVTAVNSDEGFFVQADPKQDSYQGISHSGLYVYTGGNISPEPAPGDRVRVAGTVTDFFDQLQLSAVVDIDIVSSGHELPDPIPVSPQEVATGGERQWELEGMLVEVEDVRVTDVDVPPGPGDSAPTNEFIVDDSLHVNDFLYLVEPFPNLDDEYESITGVLRFANANSKLEPRDTADVHPVPPDISHFAPEKGFIEADGSGTTTLQLHLQRPPLEELTAELDYDGPGVVDGPDTVVFAPGEEIREIEFEANQTSAMDTTVEASVGESTATAEIRTFDADTERIVESVDADRPLVFQNETWQLRASLNVPAGIPTETVSLDIAPDLDADYPTSITLDTGERIAEFPIELGEDTGRYAALVSHDDTAQAYGFEVVEEPAVQIETFQNFETPGSSYLDGSFPGDLGFTWYYESARNAPVGDSAPAIDGTSMIFSADDSDLDARRVYADDIPGGITSFSIDMKQAFTGLGTRQLELFVDGESRGTSLVFGLDEDNFGEVYAFSVDNLDVHGDFDLAVHSIGERQITIDNLAITPGFGTDPDDVDFPVVELSEFVPEKSFVEVGEDFTETIELQLAGPALDDATVDLDYSDPDAVDGPDELNFEIGDVASTVEIEALESRDAPVELTATFQGDSVTAEIHPFDESTPRTITEFSACHGGLLGQTLEFSVAVDIPAPDGGLSLDVSVEPEEFVEQQPDDVVVEAGDQTAEFELAFDQQDGTADVSVTTGDDTASTPVEVFDVTPPMVEDFSALPSDSGYTDGEFTGNYGFVWAYFSADRTLQWAIDDVSLLFGGDDPSALSAENLPGGLSAFSVDMRKAFSSSADRQLELLVNDESVATSQVFGDFDGESDEVYTFEVDDLGVTCLESIEIRSVADGQVAIDNVTLVPDTADQ